jgi:hypothetical protein
LVVSTDEGISKQGLGSARKGIPAIEEMLGVQTTEHKEYQWSWSAREKSRSDLENGRLARQVHGSWSVGEIHSNRLEHTIHIVAEAANPLGAPKATQTRIYRLVHAKLIHQLLRHQDFIFGSRKIERLAPLLGHPREIYAAQLHIYNTQDAMHAMYAKPSTTHSNTPNTKHNKHTQCTPATTT